VHVVAVAVKAEQVLSFLHPTGDNTWQNPVPSWQASQDVALWATSCVWLSFNLVLLPIFVYCIVHKTYEAWFCDATETTIWVGLSRLGPNKEGQVVPEDSKGRERLVKKLQTDLSMALKNILEASEFVNEEIQRNGTRIKRVRLMTRHRKTFSGHHAIGTEADKPAVKRDSDIYLPERLVTVILPPTTRTDAPGESVEATSLHGSVIKAMMSRNSSLDGATLPVTDLPRDHGQWILLDFDNDRLARVAQLALLEAFPPPLPPPHAPQPLPPDSYLQSKELVCIAATAPGVCREKLLGDLKVALMNGFQMESTQPQAESTQNPECGHAVCEMALPEYKYMLKAATSSAAEYAEAYSRARENSLRRLRPVAAGLIAHISASLSGR